MPSTEHRAHSQQWLALSKPPTHHKCLHISSVCIVHCKRSVENLIHIIPSMEYNIEILLTLSRSFEKTMTGSSNGEDFIFLVSVL